MYGRDVLLLPPHAGAREGVVVTMLTAPTASAQVQSPIEVGETGVLLRPMKLYVRLAHAVGAAATGAVVDVTADTAERATGTVASAVGAAPPALASCGTTSAPASGAAPSGAGVLGGGATVSVGVVPVGVPGTVGAAVSRAVSWRCGGCRVSWWGRRWGLSWRRRESVVAVVTSVTGCGSAGLAGGAGAVIVWAAASVVAATEVAGCAAATAGLAALTARSGGGAALEAVWGWRCRWP